MDGHNLMKAEASDSINRVEAKRCAKDAGHWNLSGCVPTCPLRVASVTSMEPAAVR